MVHVSSTNYLTLLTFAWNVERSTITLRVPLKQTEHCIPLNFLMISSDGMNQWCGAIIAIVLCRALNRKHFRGHCARLPETKFDKSHVSVVSPALLQKYLHSYLSKTKRSNSYITALAEQMGSQEIPM